MVPNRPQPYLDEARDASRTTLQSVHPPAALLYQRRRPENTTLYQVVQEYVETFFAQVELETGAGLPQFVKDEFEAFLYTAAPISAPPSNASAAISPVPPWA